MESNADAGRYHRYHEPDPEMEDGCEGTPHKPFYATKRQDGQDGCWFSRQLIVQCSCTQFNDDAINE